MGVFPHQNMSPFVDCLVRLMGCFILPAAGFGHLAAWWIVGWWWTYPTEKYEFVSWDDEIPNIYIYMEIYGNIIWKTTRKSSACGLFRSFIPSAEKDLCHVLLGCQCWNCSLNQSHQQRLRVALSARNPGIWTKILDTQLRALRSCPQLITVTKPGHDMGQLGSVGSLWDISPEILWWLMKCYDPQASNSRSGLLECLGHETLQFCGFLWFCTCPNYGQGSRSKLWPRFKILEKKHNIVKKNSLQTRSGQK